MAKVKTGSLLLMILLAALVFWTSQRTAHAEESWTDSFELNLEGALIGSPWGAVSTYADGTYQPPHDQLICAHLGDNTGGYAASTTYRLTRSVDVEYTGTQIQFFASYLMADTDDFATFSYSTDGGFTWTVLWGPVSATIMQTWIQVGPYNLPVGTNAIRFYFESSTTGVCSPGGLWIDKVEFLNPGFPITVISDWGDPIPPQGVNMIPENNNAISLSVSSPYENPLLEGVRYVCAGYIGDGSIVPQSTPNNSPLDSVDVVVDGVGWIEWLWDIEYAVKTVSQDGVGVPDTETTSWFAANTVASISGTDYVESSVQGRGWRCVGYTGTGSAPAAGDFLVGEDVEMSFLILEFSTITWIWESQFILYIVNEGGWGNPDPSADTWYDVGAQVSASVDNLDVEGDTIRHYLTGYILQIGSFAPQNGNDRVVSFELTAPSSLTWLWETEFILDIRNPQFIGTVDPDIGTYWITEGTPVTCSASSPVSDGVDTYLAVGYTYNGVETLFSNYENPQTVFIMSDTVLFEWIWELETLPFQVNSEFGEPSPSVGMHYYSYETIVNASVSSPYYPAGQDGVMHVCTGYTATGSINPSESSQLSISFTLVDQGTSITWLWYTQYRLIILSEQPDVDTNPEMVQNGYWYVQGETVNASCEARISGYRCSGYLVTEGTSQATGSETYVTITMNAPTTITWQWEEEELLTTLPDWNDPLQITAIDSTVGLYCSMKRNPVTGYPSYAYYKVNGSEQGALYYLYWDGTNWHAEAVDEVNGGNVGLYASLQIDAYNRPHIAYYDAENGDLKYAYRSVSGGWIVTVVDAGGASDNVVGLYCSLQLNSLNEPRIAYFNQTENDLKYAAQEYGVWNVYVVDSTGTVGSHACLALDPDTDFPRIAYRDNGNQSLKFAWYENENWKTMTVDASDDTGYSPSMIIDATGNAHIAYQLFNGASSALVYAIQSGSSFYATTVVAENNASTGFAPSLVLDSTGHPHIVFNDNATHSLIFAVYNGSEWLIDTLDETSVGSYTSMDLFEDVPAVGYWSDTGLRYIEAKTSSTTGGNSIPQNAADDTVQKGGGCFVATSAFGSYASTSVADLCSVRDGRFLASSNGDAIVGLYYTVSPAIARDFTDSSKAIVRRMLNAIR